MPNDRRFEIAVWIPGAFCFVLAILPLLVNPAGGASPAFLCFVPMCFVFVGMQNLALHRRIAVLEAHAKRGAEPGPQPTEPA